MIRWGVLSTANIGRAAVNPAIGASSNGTLAAVASREAERAQAFAAKHSIPVAYGSYDALLDDPDVDAVYLPLPNSLHRTWVLRAVAAGKHVLCEKPLALNAAEAEEMAAAAREHGVKLMEAFMYRFHPRTERIIEMVRGGRVGTVGAVRSAFTFRLTRPDDIRLDADLGGGSLMDVGCYCVNVSRTMIGEEPEEVQATASWTDSGVDDRLAGLMRFPGGAVAHFDCALTLERCEYYEVGGTDGVLRASKAFLPGTSEVCIEEARGRAGTTVHPVDGVDEYRLMVEHFADCVLHDRSPRWPVEEAAANLRAISALYRSARAGGAVVRV